jgi:hypothetical protein
MKEEPEFVNLVYTIASFRDKMCIYFIINKRVVQVFTELR